MLVYMCSAYACNPSPWQKAGSQTLGHLPLPYSASNRSSSTAVQASSGPALEYLRFCLTRKKKKKLLQQGSTLPCLSGLSLFPAHQGPYLTGEWMGQNWLLHPEWLTWDSNFTFTRLLKLKRNRFPPPSLLNKLDIRKPNPLSLLPELDY